MFSGLGRVKPLPLLADVDVAGRRTWPLSARLQPARVRRRARASHETDTLQAHELHSASRTSLAGVHEGEGISTSPGRASPDPFRVRRCGPALDIDPPTTMISPLVIQGSACIGLPRFA
jgi:hypothetical protein